MSVTMTRNGPDAAPTSVDELAEAVRDLPGPVAATGAGTAFEWGGRPEATSSVDLLGLAGVISHRPGDMTVAVGAGTRLVDLQETLAEHGQRVALDAARSRRGSTVAGLVATADSGPLAMTYGSLRDLVIGATVVLADGTVARTGGHVIKNVAGYDLAKLLHGAYGTLAVIAELVLRLHPVPQRRISASTEVPLDRAVEVAGLITSGPEDVTAIAWSAQDMDAPGTLISRYEGTEAGSRARAEAVVARVGGVERPARVVEADESDAAWDEVLDRIDVAVTDRAVLRIGVRPHDLPAVLRRLHREAGGLADVVAFPSTGVATFSVPADASAVDRVHRAAHDARGTSSLRQHRPDAALPAWGPAPSSAPLLRSVTDALDPQRRLGRGRFSAWIGEPQGGTA